MLKAPEEEFLVISDLSGHIETNEAQYVVYGSAKKRYAVCDPLYKKGPLALSII